jgi:hypothetical protein
MAARLINKVNGVSSAEAESALATPYSIAPADQRGSTASTRASIAVLRLPELVDRALSAFPVSIVETELDDLDPIVSTVAEDTSAEEEFRW